MADYNHYCSKCGWQMTNPTASYYNCPSCGKSDSVRSTDITSTSEYLYLHKCLDCGWASGIDSTAGSCVPCPSCGGRRVSSTKISSSKKIGSSSDQKSSSTNSSDDGNPWAFLVLVLIFVAFVLVLFPGAMITMLLDTFINISPGWGSFFLCLGFSGLIFMLTGFNIMKYVILDVSLIVIFMILALSIKDFCPFLFAKEHVLPVFFAK